MMENCKINEWEGGKNKLRNQSFILNEDICPHFLALIQAFNLKRTTHCRDSYESFFRVCGKMIKLIMKEEKKEVRVEGWCDEKIESIIILDEMLSEIKFCFGVD